MTDTNVLEADILKEAEYESATFGKDIKEAEWWVEYWKERRERVERGRREEGRNYYEKMKKDELRHEILVSQDNNPIMAVLMRGRKITKRLLIDIMIGIDDDAIEDFIRKEEMAEKIVAKLKEEMAESYAVRKKNNEEKV
jgi:hypothetical protein